MCGEVLVDTSIEKNPGEIIATVFPDLGISYFCGSGNVTYSLVLEHIKKLHSHSDWSTKLDAYIDFGGAIVDVDSDGFEQYQEFFINIQKANKPRRWALFTRQGMTHKSANMSHLVQSETIKVEVFTSEKESLAFLKIDEESFEIARSTLFKSVI